MRLPIRQGCYFNNEQNRHIILIYNKQVQESNMIKKSLFDQNGPKKYNLLFYNSNTGHLCYSKGRQKPLS